MKLETEIIDKLFLELSQVSKARTGREVSLEVELAGWQRYASYCRSCALSGEHGVLEYHEFMKKTVK